MAIELRRMEKLAALEYRIDTAAEKLGVRIKIGLMDISGEIENIRLQLEEIQTQKNESTTTRS